MELKTKVTQLLKAPMVCQDGGGGASMLKVGCFHAQGSGASLSAATHRRAVDRFVRWKRNQGWMKPNPNFGGVVRKIKGYKVYVVGLDNRRYSYLLMTPPPSNLVATRGDIAARYLTAEKLNKKQGTRTPSPRTHSPVPSMDQKRIPRPLSAGLVAEAS
jgi:hypothetical protein